MLIVLEGERCANWQTIYKSRNDHVRNKIAKEKHELVITYLRSEYLPDSDDPDKPYKPLPYPVKLTYTAYSKGNICDPENLCSKVYTDGLVRAGILEDDSSKYVHSVTLISRKDNKRQRLEILIEPDIIDS